MAQAPPSARALDLPSWKALINWASACLLAVLFLSSGVWKLVDPLGWESRLVQALIWPQLALAGAIGVGLLEAWSAVLLLVPRWRRWGALLAALLLIVFMVYFAWNYETLRGDDCSCFPWLKRAVGPGFFIGDGAMLLAALLAGLWIRPAEGWRRALVALAALAVFAGAMYGVSRAQLTGLEAPSPVADLKPGARAISLKHGKVLLYFFDPMCSHCYRVAKQMGAWQWNQEVRLVAVPTAMPELAAGFLEDTALAGRALTTADKQKLRDVFRFGDPPYAVALEHGRQVEAFGVFEGDTYLSGLKRLGFLETNSR
jgi:uncharacterized membrane protein YphA (DoxX/SURF4 family)